MRKIALVLALALTVTGCAGLSKGIFGVDVTASVNNVTPRQVYKIEQAAKAGVAGLLAYRRLCIAGRADTHCRANIEHIQVYTRQLCTTYANRRCQTGILADLRNFVRENDQVNAVRAFELARTLLSNIQSARLAAGV